MPTQPDYNPQEHHTRIEEEYRRRSADDPLLFARGLVIPSASGPRLFDACIAPFQQECLELLAPSLLAIRDKRMPPRRRFWVERTKKASKDADIAICILWLMAFCKQPVLAQVSAANQQQAGIIKRRAKDLLHYNPWLNALVQIQQNKIPSANGMGETVIEATGSSGAKQGDTPDLLVLNELVHVDKWGVNETHMNNADGVPRSVVIISTNAGIKGSKAWQWRQNAIQNPDRWTVKLWKGRAPWVSEKDMEDARRRDPVGAEFARLWLGDWISGTGDAVPESEIDRCFRLLGPLDGPEIGWRYVAGLDLGISHDHAGIALLGAHPGEQRVKVARVAGFAPSLPNDQGQLEVDEERVKAECLRLCKHFRIEWFGYDPAAGGSFMAQWLRKQGVPMREMTFASDKNLNEMATRFVQVVKADKLECYEDEEGRLRRDIAKFNIVPRTKGGYRLEAISDASGHADVGTALVVCLPKAVELAGINVENLADVILHEEHSADLSPEELEAMPEQLRELCDMYDDISEDLRISKRYRQSQDY